MISLADLRARNVTPIWQEAVAVVQELIQTVKATTGSAELLPDLEHVALIANGDVVAMPGSPEPAAPVRHAAVMLKLLVDRVPIPPELEQFITRNVAEPPQYDTVAEFTRNLAFFERPGRRSDVERLVGRALVAEQTTRAEEELQRLKERASEVTQVMAAPEFLRQQSKVKTVPIALVAAVGVAVIAAALWLWQRASAPQSPAAAAATAAPAPAAAGAAAPVAPAPAPPAAAPGGSASQPPTAASAGQAGAAAAAPTTPGTGQAAPTPGAVSTPASGAASAAATQAPPIKGPRSMLERAGDAVRTAVGTLVGSKPPPPTPAMASAPNPSTEAKMAATKAPPRPRPRRTSKPAAVAAVPTPEPAPVAVAPPAPVAIAAAAFEPAPATVRGGPVLDEAVDVFTAADSTVTPPVIVRPVLPKELPPGVPASQVGTIELVVDEQGDVLHVKLVSPANRFHERMLVSAAKMWKFRPAYKDGIPVRYKTRVRLTV